MQNDPPVELTPSNVEYIENTFHQVASKDTNLMALKDVGTALRNMRLTPTDGEVLRLCQEFLDGDNKSLNLKEFQLVAARLWVVDAMMHERKLWNAFLAFDKDDCGRIPKEEMLKILCEMGEEPIPMKDAQKLLYFHTNEKQDVEYPSLIRELLK